MDAIALLTDQHRKVEKLFSAYEKAQSAAEKRSLFEELADNLAVHTTLEEKVFYPAAYAYGTRGLLEDALREHLSVKRLIVELAEMVADEESFDAKVRLMKEQVQQHVQEEEAELFPRVRERLNEAQLRALAGRMQGLFAREMKAGATRKLDTQLDEAPDITTDAARHWQ